MSGDQVWNDDRVQFARLISELESIGVLADNYDAIVEQLGLEDQPQALGDLIGRAQKVFQDSARVKQSPATAGLVAAVSDSNGKRLLLAETVRKFIEAGADVNARDDDGQPILHHACQHHSADVVKVLIDNGADVNATSDQFLHTPLQHTILYTKDIAVMELLIAAGADLDAQSGSEDTALGIAAAFDVADAVELLIKAGANVNAVNNNNDTPLIKAAEVASNDSAKLLLDAGADPNIVSDDQHAALLYAVEKDNIELVTLLMKAGANPGLAVEGEPIWQRALNLTQHAAVRLILAGS